MCVWYHQTMVLFMVCRLLKFSAESGILCMKQWEAVGFPLCLTSLMYMGWFILKCYQFGAHGPNMGIVRWICHFMDISVWRMYIVAPFTEELVFRACMISLLLCGGFKPYTVILLSPVLFSLAHLNHLLEFYIQQNSSLLKASMVVGFQLGYTVIFGSYASFLFVRTGW
ncbi:putative CPBP intramembrane metalloprotease [Helianthus annuus]|nr:putative CPBP intramembrane metalloprotease [Helianthus annuus]KAJ0624822.1 putative CPBP intramembrane metalloprotease [Helianthus annuus]KAJ0628472.1 putative Type II CAAX prenyl endopeptidase Rce1 [Helianthus annuus]KAJ0949858.1 putative CPBP intramembrane metalloprotease [Helianthus annuus]